MAHLAKLLLKHKVPVGVSLVSPYIENRENARKIVDDNEKFSEVYVKCSLEKCEERDVKGMYKKARAGEIKNFTGIDDPYEALHQIQTLQWIRKTTLSMQAHRQL